MRRQRSTFRTSTALVAASAMSFAFAAAAPPAAASAPDPGVPQLQALVDRIADVTEDLGTVGRLAEQLPTVGVSAGAAVGFPDLVQKTIADHVTGRQHWDDFDDAEIDLTDAAAGRTGTLTLDNTETDGDYTLSVDLDVTRTLAPQPFSFAHETPRVSLSSPSGVQVSARTRLSFDIVVEQVSTDVFVPYVVAGPGGPTLTVDLEADIPGSAVLSAAVGILGVELTETSSDDTPDVELHLTGTVADPNGDGRLYQIAPDGTAGELSGEGIAAGLFTIGFAPTGGGSVDLALSLEAATDTGFGLPGVNATVLITWADIATGAPSVEVTGLDPVQAFLNLSTRDLADLVGQVASTIAAGQRDNGGNLPLPFLSGTLADAVKGAELLTAFLEQYVVPAPPEGSPPGPIAAGTPLFTSLQDLIAKLNSALKSDGVTALLPGAEIVAEVEGFDPATSRLPIHLELARTAPAAEPVVEETVATSGVANYGPSSLTASADFAPDLVGRRVTAGSSGGTVAGVAGPTLTLSAPWTGGTPTNGTPYAVAGPQVDAGTVNLADLLQSGGKGIGGANAIRSTASVSPSYRVTLDLALDLSEPRTGSDCTGAGAGVACPYERSNPDGSSTVVTSEPLPVERLLLKNSGTLLSADFPMTAGIDLNARAGFLGVRVGGEVKVCRSTQSDTCTGTGTAPMIAVELEPAPGEDPGTYVPVRDFFATLVTAAGDPQRFTATSDVRGYVTGSVTVPGADAFLPSGATAGFTLTWDDIATGAPDVVVDDLSELTAFDVDPNNPQALLGVVLRVLQLLDEELRSGGGSGLFDAQVPLVEASLRDFLGADESGGGPTTSYPTVGERTRLVDTSRPTSLTEDRAFPTDLAGRSILVGTSVAVVETVVDGRTLQLSSALTPAPATATPYFLRSELADAITLLTGTTPDTLQELVSRLDERLGADSPVRFRAAPVAGVPALIVDVDWKRNYATSAPIKLDLLPGQDLAGAAAEGQASVAVEALVDVDLVVPLTGTALPTTLQVLDTSEVSVEAEAAIDGSIRASIGPLSVALGKPGATDDADKAQARAHYELGVSKSGATGAAVPLADFLADAQIQVNDYAGGVSCGAQPAETGDDLALCARLPLFVTTDGSDWTKPAMNDIAVRLPKDGDDATELFSLSGPVSAGDARPRLQTPTAAQLEAAFLSLLLDFGMIGDGLDAFLALIEDGLRAATLDGKLPLIGGDLQAGADFVGDLRTELDALFAQVEAVNDGRLPTIAQVQDLLGTEFENALEAAGANPEDFALDLTCLLPSTDVTAVTPSDTEPGAVDLAYAVLTQGKTGGDATVETVPGEDMTVSAAATGTVTIEWDEVEAATGYMVVRSKDAGATWENVQEVAAGVVSHVDDVDTAGTAKELPTERALVVTCAGVSMTDLQGVQIRADIGTGDPHATSASGDILGCRTLERPPAGPENDKPCLEGTLPLDIGIPGLALRAARGDDGGAGGLTGALGYRIHLALELDRENGFSLLTEDADSSGKSHPEIAIGAAVDLSEPGTPTDPALQAELAFLKIGVNKTGDAASLERPGFAARFSIDLKAPGDDDCFDGCTPGATPKRLGFAELQAADSGSDVVRSELRLNAHVEWFLKAEIESALPGVQAVFLLDWQATFDPTGGTAEDVAAARGKDLTIAFEDVAISAGGFLSQVLDPIVTQIKSVTGPLQPVIDTLYAPIPVLSDLSKLAGGGDVTLITLAKAFSTVAGGPRLEFIDTVKNVIEFVNNLPTGDQDVVIPIGSFTVLGEQALATPATPDNGGSLIGSTSDVVADLAGELDAKTTNGKKSLKGSDSVAAKSGFAFPVFENPASIFNLLMGQDIDLVTFDSGNLTLGFTWRQSFGPVYAPPPVFITLSGTASVTARIYAGFDTYGIRKAFEEDPDRSALAGIAQVLDGLFFFTTEDDGSPLPVITLFGEIAAGAAVSAVVITVGIEGGVRLTVAFSWNDPNGDGKFRLFEFGQVALRNPICLFQVSGALSLFLKVYITIGVSIFSVSFDFTLVDIVLLDFSAKPDCEPPPPLLGGTTGTTLVLFAGKLGQGPRGDAAWHNIRDGEALDDVFKVTALHTYADGAEPVFKGVRVQALGISEDFLDPNLERVVVDGREHAGQLKVTFLSDGEQTGAADKDDKSPNATSDFGLEVVAIGGSGDDTIKTGTGNALLDGRGGNDALTTSDVPGSTVRIAGGAGNDSITTSHADGTVAGDSTLGDAQADRTVASTRGNVALSNVIDWTALTAPGEGEGGGVGDDRIAVGLGQNTVYGGPGNDAIGVAADDPRTQLDPPQGLRSKGNTVVLGTGSDTFKGGTGADTVWTGPKTAATRATLDGAHGVDTSGADDGGATVRNVVDTGSGGDTVFGSNAVDLVTGGSTTTQVDHVRGGGGNDVLLGGLGSDQLFGGPDDDWVVAEPATVGEQTSTDDFGAVRSYTKTPLATAPSSKLLVGGDGRDRVVGGDGASVLFGDRYETSPCGTPTASPLSTPPVEPTGGAPGRDLVLGGSGVDRVKAGGADDRIEAYDGNDLLCGQAGADVVLAGNGADTVWGGTGDDLAYGDAGTDSVFGNDGADRLFGGDDVDVVEGNDGADDLFGGRADDVLVGGTRAAGKQDLGRDRIYGDEGEDVLVGDNAKADGSYPVDLDGATPTAGDGDALSGGAGDDKAYGGLGDDEVAGDAGHDDLEGNLGRDTVRGGLGNDQVIGGSSEAPAAGTGYADVDDDLFGDEGFDVLAGDNAVLSRTGPDAGSVVLRGRGFPTGHDVTLLDLGHTPTAGTSGGDRVSGGADPDAIFGQGGDDTLSGQGADDLIEGGPGSDLLTGGDGQDDLVGGSSAPTGDGRGQPDAGDTIRGGNGDDLVLGDNAALRRVGAVHPLVVGRLLTPRGVDLLDLGDDADSRNADADLIEGGAGADVLLGQAGDDHVDGGAQDDYLEGGPGSDLLQGQEGQDDLVGGSYTPLDPATHPLDPPATASGQPDGADQLRGGADDDVLAGDNAYLLRQGDTSRLSERLGSVGPLHARRLVLLDRENPGRLDLPDATRFGGDQLAGGHGVDLLFGQDGDDLVSGGGGDDYLQGNGGADLLRGDASPEAVRAGIVAPPFVEGSWPAAPSSYSDGPAQDDGQDDLIGGSDVRGFRDGGDTVEGNGGDDAVLADNGSLVRTVVDGAERTYTARQRPTVERIAEPGLLTPQESTRFCQPVGGRCEVVGAFGDDAVHGDDGDDGLWAQDGDDTVRGGAGDDDVFGELGDDTLFGEAGEDVLLGDRGGVRGELASGMARTVSLNAPPAESYTAVPDGSYTRRVDLQNDTDGQRWVGTGTQATMPLGGLVAGGRDRIRGGTGDDQVHAGSGDDLVNGDGGGDDLFGDDGADVMWGGKGCEPGVAENPCSGSELSERGAGDRFVDHLMGGRGGDPDNPVLGADILDWKPRGAFADCVEAPWPREAGTDSAQDPCDWFRMTSTDDADPADDQHHQGTDWMYGGWDRDVMQADLAANGPNPGDRMIDWNGVYNLFSHCNAAYGGFNDVRQHSPGMQSFLQALAYGMGAGQVAGDADTPGTSAYRELQLAYPQDKGYSTGKPYPSSPGHFDDPEACST